MIDTSTVRVHLHAGSAKKGALAIVTWDVSRGGLTTKMHALVDGEGMPLKIGLTAGERHDNTLARDLLADLPEGALVLAGPRLRCALDQTGCRQPGRLGQHPVRKASIGKREPIVFSPRLYKARNAIERFFARLKQFRAIATRYDKLAANFLAAVKLACLRLWLRRYESTS